MNESTPTHDSHARAGGYIVGAPEVPAYVLHAQEPSEIPVLIAAPHGGRSYPPQLLRELRHGDSAALRLEDRYVDLLAQAVARGTGAHLLLARAPRAMIDLNRAPEDIDWDMFRRQDRPDGPLPAPSRRARSGLGLIPRRLPGTGELWRRRLSARELADRLDGIHRPYHEALGQTLADIRKRWGAALLIDLHSMPPLPATGGTMKTEVVLGDRFGASCHGSMAAAAFAGLARAGRGAAHNRPYAGGYVLDRHADPREGVHALQIEVDRSCYLDSNLIEPGPGMDRMVRDLSDLVCGLAALAADLGQDKSWPMAAE